MLEEIDFKEGKLVFFKNANFWEKLLNKCDESTSFVQIATYNFNFSYQEKDSHYYKLAELANIGIDVSLIYSINNGPEKELDYLFKNFITCFQLKENHLKLFITDNFAYIGTANFSFGSNSNYEGGVIFYSEEIINKMSSKFRKMQIASNLTCAPLQFSEPFNILCDLIYWVEKLKEIETLDIFKEEYNSEMITQLRFVTDVKKYYDKLQFCDIQLYDWGFIYYRLNEGLTISELEFLNFKIYLDTLYRSLSFLKKMIIQQYKEKGRLTFLKEQGWA